jgi:hypothetical protein
VRWAETLILGLSVTTGAGMWITLTIVVGPPFTTPAVDAAVPRVETANGRMIDAGNNGANHARKRRVRCFVFAAGGGTVSGTVVPPAGLDRSPPVVVTRLAGDMARRALATVAAS